MTSANKPIPQIGSKSSTAKSVREKPIPVMAKPNNWSGFNQRELLPWKVSRADAAATLWRVRLLTRRGQARFEIQRTPEGKLKSYFLDALNSIVLTTR